MLCWADAFPASVTFDAIAASLSASEADKKEALSLGKAVFAFTLTNDKGQTESWYLDLKKTGAVGKGPAPPGGKADGAFLPFYSCALSWPFFANCSKVTLALSEKDFAGLVAGTANAQKLFMGGKLKVKGNVMKATKMEAILNKAKSRAKL